MLFRHSRLKSVLEAAVYELYRMERIKFAIVVYVTCLKRILLGHPVSARTQIWYDTAGAKVVIKALASTD